MAEVPLPPLIRHVRRLARLSAAPATDRQLLERFLVLHCQDAFTRLVERHGALVWNACWRILRHRQDAEDAFQATFLVLARKANQVPWRESIAGWLYQVAARLAAEIRKRNVRRAWHEARASERVKSAPDAACQRLCEVLDEELLRLPARYRSPVLLCYLEGRTGDQAARILGWSLRTLQRRLAQGRDLLRQRLTRRGITLSATLLVPMLIPDLVSAAVPPGLLETVARTTARGSSAAATRLAETFLKGIAMTKWKSLTLLTLALGTAASVGALIPLAAGNPLVDPGEGDAPPAVKAAADQSAPLGNPAATFAGHAWAILEVIQQKHLEPPPRPALLLAGTQTMLQKAKVPAPQDLKAQVSEIQSPDQLAAFLKRLQPMVGHQVPQAELETAFIQGVLADLPGKGEFVPAFQARAMTQASANRYVGIGIQLGISKDEHFPQIMEAMARGPALKGGIKSGDLLVRINGQDTHDMLLVRAVELLRGEEGSTLTVDVRAPGTSKTRTVTMTRSVVPFDSVFGYRRLGDADWDYRIDSGLPVAYLWISALRSSTPHELRQLERRFRTEGIRAVVLDLRAGAPDPVLHPAALVADALLDHGVMWRVVSPQGRVQEFRADAECLFRGWPMAVLIDESLPQPQAAVAAALQDNGRAVLIGEATKNSGHLRGMADLPDSQDALMIWTARMERAAQDRSWPVLPDHTVTMTPEQQKELNKWFETKTRASAAAPSKNPGPVDLPLARAVEWLHGQLKKADLTSQP
jgi:C-terminal peptidase prc